MISVPSEVAAPPRAVAARRRVAWSLRNRLLLLATFATLTAWIAGAVGVHLATIEESTRLFDERLHEIGRVVLSFADHEIDEVQSEGRGVVHVETSQTLGARYKYQIFSADGALLLLSFDAPTVPFAPFEQQGFVTRSIGGVPMRTHAMFDDDRDKVVLVAEPISARETFVGSVYWYLALAAAISLTALLALNGWLLRRATQALQDSADQLIDRSPTDLRPIAVADPPRELEPLIRSMNRLFERFDNALAAERRLTSAAAHELRTPLAAIKVQAQVALRGRTPAESSTALSNLIVCVDRAARMVDQLLTLARLDRLAATQAAHEVVSVDVVTAHVLDELAPLLAERGVRLTTALQPVQIVGMEFGIAVLMRNLIENAVRYSPPGSALRIATGRDGAGSYAVVDDAGPGIPPAEREHVFELFYRLPDAPEGGCGIGLSIVRAVAHVHEAQIALDESPLGGLRVTVRFPSCRETAEHLGEDISPPDRASG
jgi:signal transduction histidine kinase